MKEGRLQIEVWNLNIPLDPPLPAPLGVITMTHVLLAFAKDSQGNRGIGYSWFLKSDDLERATRAVNKLLELSGPVLTRLSHIERLEELTENGVLAGGKDAASALSLAAWDLLGQQRSCPCADLWGRPPGRDAIDCYASALWMNGSTTDLVNEARGHREQNYRAVKMRTRGSLQENLQRIAAVRQIYPEARTIALEVGFSWNLASTNEFLREAPKDLLWIEDPVSYDLIERIDRSDFNPVAAGETCPSIPKLLDLLESGGVRLLILDVQRLGGPVRFLEAARLLHSLGTSVGSHRFPYYSTHLLACLPQSMPVEMIDWANPALEPFPPPAKAGKLPIRGPGFGIRLNQAVFQQFGRKVISMN